MDHHWEWFKVCNNMNITLSTYKCRGLTNQDNTLTKFNEEAAKKQQSSSSQQIITFDDLLTAFFPSCA